ncbi:Ferri-bacillibactin esterase BesA [Caulifigura coniformis]|uniref:Ferri-bacillibactin esterase BesA n=1 Tax=Caulifigura coniformis TaxID=2527983 RepID=A0A517S941_9PLAN|nr:alpha/beta hydrolase-fold protein [Caulifigura coniformis]QDT52632.1 Ferri-bacillibactin esterase BesA [Caulifigura coniformis]
MIRHSPTFALFVVATIGTAVQADTPSRITDHGEYRLPRTNDLALRSKAGRDYRLLISSPEGEPPEAGFPVLYVLDANSCFGTVVEAQRLQVRRGQTTGITPAVIVGIGYPGDGPFDPGRRTYDLTTPGEAGKLPRRPDGSPWPASGGADEFLDFIENEVKPLVESRVQIDRSRQAIFGHSFGGLFVLHAMFNRPEAFHSYIAASPSVWWNDFALQKAEERFAKRCAQSPVRLRLRVTTGELEKNSGPTARLAPTAASTGFGSTEDMAMRLQKLADRGVRVEFHEYPGENHGSVLPVALNHGLRFALTSETRDGPKRE